ncbi:MAG: YceI family protein [Solirubrobacterales bacterium]|nr:YceI family protein [Solirubrobacterales bacterium]
MGTNATPIIGIYAADPIHSSAGFAVKYMGVSTFRATFDRLNATLKGGSDGITLEGAAEVDSISIHSPEQFRANVLGPEFFDAEARPQITFTASEVLLSDDGIALVRGALTIKGNTRQIVAQGTWSPPASDSSGKTRSHLGLEATINRRDFGIIWDAPLPSGGTALADEVTITVELALVATD